MRESKLASWNWVPTGALTFRARAGGSDLARWNPAAATQMSADLVKGAVEPESVQAFCYVQSRPPLSETLEPSLGLKRLAGDNVQAIGRNNRRHSERTAGSFLAAMAVADIGRQQRTRHNVADLEDELPSRSFVAYRANRISKSQAVHVSGKDKPVIVEVAPGRGERSVSAAYSASPVAFRPFSLACR
jgi:hypothetical protein